MMLPNVFLETPIAHRTLHDVSDGRPENSLAGAAAAIARGYAIELDLQMSKDGVPMVFHDYSLERLTDEVGAVAQRTAAHLGAIRLKHGDECIPTLEEFLEFVDGRVPLLVEIKDQDGALGPNVGALEQAACAVLKNYTGPAALMSFNPYSIEKCAEYAPDIPRGLVTGTFLAKDWMFVPEGRRMALAGIPDYERVGACFISHHVMHLEDAVVTYRKQQGAAIICWTVRTAMIEDLARKVADNVTFEGYLA
ncbi:MAG: phosphodiesterase [Proteobacteria bacterium]|nr:phosphodiesterase [Pseudomonadota bacterium]